LRNLQNVVYFTRREVLGQLPREMALEMLGTLYAEQGRRPVRSQEIALRMGVSDTRVWKLLGEAKQRGLARPIRQKGWEPVELTEETKTV
jgi:Mn-dependent DtxR family transcriptional regulator